MPKYNNRLQPHKERKRALSSKKEFDIEVAFSQKKLNRHVLIGLICALFGNKIIAVIYLYHQYKLHLLLEGKNDSMLGKERSYYIRLRILKELSLITICFRIFILVMFCMGLVKAINNLPSIYPS